MRGGGIGSKLKLPLQAVIEEVIQQIFFPDPFSDGTIPKNANPNIKPKFPPKGKAGDYNGDGLIPFLIISVNILSGEYSDTGTGNGVIFCFQYETIPYYSSEGYQGNILKFIPIVKQLSAYPGLIAYLADGSKLFGFQYQQDLINGLNTNGTEFQYFERTSFIRYIIEIEDIEQAFISNEGLQFPTPPDDSEYPPFEGATPPLFPDDGFPPDDQEPECEGEDCMTCRFNPHVIEKIIDTKLKEYFVDTSVDLYDEEKVKIEKTKLKHWKGTEGLFTQLAKIRRDGTVASLPEVYETQRLAERPQMVIIYRSVVNKRAGNYQIAIPWAQNKKPKFIKYKKGSISVVLTLTDGSRLVVNAATEAEGKRVIDAYKPIILPAKLEGSVLTTFRRTGKKLAEAEMMPIRGDYYSFGYFKDVPKSKMYYPAEKA